MTAPARIRVTAQNFVFLDCDVKTLVLHLLCGIGGLALQPAKSKQMATIMLQPKYRILIETRACNTTQFETIEPEAEDENG